MGEKAHLGFKAALATASLISAVLFVNAGRAIEQFQDKPGLPSSSDQMMLAQDTPQPPDKEELRKKQEKEKKQQEEIKRMVEDLLPGLLGKPAPSIGFTPATTETVKPAAVPPAAKMPQPISGTVTAPSMPAPSAPAQK